MVGQSIILRMDDNFEITELDWYDIINNSTVIVSHSHYDEEMTRKYLINGLIDKEIGTPDIRSLYQEENGDICFQFAFGIIVANNKIMSAGNGETRESASIFPNPVENVLNFSNKENFEKYEIFDLVGNKLMQGEINQANINVSNLPKGAYVFKVFTSSSFKHLKFVKI